MIDFRNMTQQELKDWVLAVDEKAFRANQIYEWIVKGVDCVEEMKNLPLSLKEKISQEGYIQNTWIKKWDESKDGTIKALIELKDGQFVEAVLMKYKYGYTACLSTQVGCRMKCSFCASTIHGRVRNLTAGEMLGQIYCIQNKSKIKINNIVLMGSGEPLDNYDETLKFIKYVTDEKGINLSSRSLTLSTCGLVPEIYKLAEEKLQLTLAISLHNPIQDERAEIMPISKKYPISDLMDAVKYYIKKTNRRVTFEYALINGVNDKIRHAQALGKCLKDHLVHVNLIPVNPVDEYGFKPADNRSIQAFKKVLEKEFHIPTTVRRELGSDINAACGQLRNKELEKAE